jgi:hypothetical protein
MKIATIIIAQNAHHGGIDATEFHCLVRESDGRQHSISCMQEGNVMTAAQAAQMFRAFAAKIEQMA